MEKTINLIPKFCVAAVLSIMGTAVVNGKTVNRGPWSVNIDRGCVSLDYDGCTVINKSMAEWGLDSIRHSVGEIKNIKVTQTSLADKFGNGTVVTLSGAAPDGYTYLQRFYLYDGKDYILTDFEITSPREIKLNYMAPLSSTESYRAFSRAGNNMVFVPYDNDAWVRYKLTPFGQTSPDSYEVSALFNSDTREGIIVGSIEHDTWKTGIKAASHNAPTDVDTLKVFGGISSNLTRDVRPHGAVKGRKVKSPKIMIGRFDDWRNGMETFADLCSIEAPRIDSRGPRPFGWNSWGKLATKVNYRNASEVARFVKDELQPKGFFNADSTVCIGLDAFWDFGLTPEQLVEFAEQRHKNGQLAGIYFCPFTDWGKNPEGEIAEAPGYKWKDTYLLCDGKPIEFDGAYALDPTHPAVKKRIEHMFNQFKERGYDFVKIDFMAHGAYESDSHFNPDVTTGVQAYNEGMAFIDSVADGKLWINLSIAPLFPANYAHSRRIGCDAWADINNTEYSLNALTYGWWLDHVYHYNDADHIVMEGVTDGENRARLTSSAITGLFLLGDDLSSTGLPEVKDKVLRTATNDCINKMARECKSFRPVEHGDGDRGADMFVGEGNDGCLYVALFNFTDRSQRKHLKMHRLGLSDGIDYSALELWSRDTSTLRGAIDVEVPAKDVRVFRIKK